MIIKPNPKNKELTRPLSAYDHTGALINVSLIEERPLTIYLNSQEIVTAMSICDYPKYLALGFLKNQGMIEDISQISAVDYDDELGVVVVRTHDKTNFEEKLSKKTRTSGCALGTVFGDMMEGLEDLVLPKTLIKEEWLFTLSKEINTTPSLYLEAGAIHSTVLCQEDKVLVYMEDVGRHNAVDKIAGWLMETGTNPSNKILYTTGRLTSEMVIKTISMGIGALVSRSGFTAWGAEIAHDYNLALIGRLRGTRYIIVSGHDRLIKENCP